MHLIVKITLLFEHLLPAPYHGRNPTHNRAFSDPVVIFVYSHRCLISASKAECFSAILQGCFSVIPGFLLLSFVLWDKNVCAVYVFMDICCLLHISCVQLTRINRIHKFKLELIPLCLSLGSLVCCASPELLTNICVV